MFSVNIGNIIIVSMSGVRHKLKKSNPQFTHTKLNIVLCRYVDWYLQVSIFWFKTSGIYTIWIFCLLNLLIIYIYKPSNKEKRRNFEFLDNWTFRIKKNYSYEYWTVTALLQRTVINYALWKTFQSALILRPSKRTLTVFFLYRRY